MSFLTDGTSRHRQFWDLIPWLVNGRASAEERRIVEHHLSSCEDCRMEYEFQHCLSVEMAQDDDWHSDAGPALQHLWMRIDDAAAPQRVAAFSPSSATARKDRAPWERWLLAALIVESIGLAGLSAIVLNLAREPLLPVYQTLTLPTPTPPQAIIRVVLARGMTFGEFQTLLAPLRLQVVAGPSDAGVYSLAPLSVPTTADTQRALAYLRARPGVRFAEPVAAPR